MLKPSKMSSGKRDSQADKIYASARWKRFSLRCRRAKPICEHCNNAAATEAHHVKKLADFPALAFVKNNVLSVCHDCHAALDGSKFQVRK